MYKIIDKSIIGADEMVLNMGPQHPSTHGVLRLKIITDGEVVSHIEPIIGYLHRCFEKHCENVSYEQVIPFTDRCDYLASMTMNFGYVVAMEQLMEIKVNDRVQYIRVIMAELQRIASHLLATGVFGLDLCAFTPFLHMLRDRERIIDLFEMIFSLGEYVKTRNSFAPYLSFTFLRNLRSGSFSNNNVSEDASSLKSFEKYPNDNNRINSIENIVFGLSIILIR